MAWNRNSDQSPISRTKLQLFVDIMQKTAWDNVPKTVPQTKGNSYSREILYIRLLQ